MKVVIEYLPASVARTVTLPLPPAVRKLVDQAVTT
jgi:hypothetical protein